MVFMFQHHLWHAVNAAIALPNLIVLLIRMYQGLFTNKYQGKRLREKYTTIFEAYNPLKLDHRFEVKVAPSVADKKKDDDVASKK